MKEIYNGPNELVIKVTYRDDRKQYEVSNRRPVSRRAYYKYFNTEAEVISHIKKHKAK